MGSVIRLVQGGLKYGFITQFFCFMQEKASIMRRKLRGSDVVKGVLVEIVFALVLSKRRFLRPRSKGVGIDLINPK